MKDPHENDPEFIVFMNAGDGVQTAINALPDWDACLVLTLALAECVVHGNSKEGEWDCTLPLIKLAQTIRVLGDVVGDMVGGRDDDDDGDDDGEDNEDPRPPSPDLLRKLLERRKAAKVGKP
jgi:hypothetical protein